MRTCRAPCSGAAIRINRRLQLLSIEHRGAHIAIPANEGWVAIGCRLPGFKQVRLQGAAWALVMGDGWIYAYVRRLTLSCSRNAKAKDFSHGGHSGDRWDQGRLGNLDQHRGRIVNSGLVTVDGRAALFRLGWSRFREGFLLSPRGLGPRATLQQIQLQLAFLGWPLSLTLCCQRP